LTDQGNFSEIHRQIDAHDLIMPQQIIIL